MEELKPNLSKLVVILGPTACGKSEWSIELAKIFNGEIVSADSRQIYQKMNIGTAKVPGCWQKQPQTKERIFVYKKTPHYLVDFVDPGAEFNLAHFKEAAIKHINEIRERGRLPFLVGGTGLYIHSVVDNLLIPKVPPNKKLRRSLESKTNEQLLAWLSRLDPVTAKTVDPKNQRRLIRALEVCIWTGRPFSEQQKKGEPLFDILQIGIEVPRPELHNRIAKRVDKMMKDGLLDEVRLLVKQRYGWDLPSMSGTGYRQFADYFQGRISREKAMENLKRDTRRYARRQLTWFRRDPRIKWVKERQEAHQLIKEFLER